MKINWKYILIFIILLIAVCAAIFYWQQNKALLAPLVSLEPINQNTSNWKTYKNEEYGFEIKYPAEWNYADRSPQSGKKASYNKVSYGFNIYFGDGNMAETPPSRGGTGFVGIMIFNATTNELFQNAFTSDKKQVVFNGINAFKIESSVGIADSNIEFPAEYLIFENNGKAFVISFENSDTRGALNQTFSNMLSTFKLAK